MKKLLLVTFFLFAPFFAYAQSNQQGSFIVLTGGGTKYIKPVNTLWGLQWPGIASTTSGCLGIDSTGWISPSGSACGTGNSSFATTSANYWLGSVTNPFQAASFVATSTATSTFQGGLATTRGFSGLFATLQTILLGTNTATTSKLTSVGTSTFGGGGLSVAEVVRASSFIATSTATSTFGGGVNLSSGCFAISSVCLSSGAVSSVSNADGTLTVSPTTGSVVASLNLSNINSWSGLQRFLGGATTTTLAVNGIGYFGNTATTTIMGNNASSTFAGGVVSTGGFRGAGGLTLTGGDIVFSAGNQNFISPSSAFNFYTAGVQAFQITNQQSLVTYDGTGATPSFALNNTGVGFFKTTGTGLGFSTNNVERAQITNGGFFGIGTTTPGKMLSVAGESNLSGTTTVGYLRSTSTIDSLGRATSTWAGGLNITSGCFSINNICTGGSGTVTSVDASGGTTGLTFSGGPITTSGTLTLAGTLGISNGGTNATSFSARSLVGFDGTRLIATSSPTVGFLTATSTATSTFVGGISSAGLASSNGLTITGGSILSSGSLSITSVATSTFAGGISTAGLASSNGITITGGSSKLGTVSSGIWNGTVIGALYGGTGQDSSAWTGMPLVQSGVWYQHATTSQLLANDFVVRDGNGNIFINNLIASTTQITSSGGTTPLTPASPRIEILSGTQDHTFRLPNAQSSGMANGSNFYFNNNSTGRLTVTDLGGNVITTLDLGAYKQVILLDNSTSNGTWDSHDMSPHNALWSNSLLFFPGNATTTQFSSGIGYFGTVSTTTIKGDSATSTFSGGISASGLASSQGLTITGGVNLPAGSIDNTELANSTISGIALGGTLGALSATDSTLTFSGSYDGSAARTIGLNLANDNIWSGLQNYTNAATSTWTGGLYSKLGFSGLYGTFQTLGLGSGTASTTLSGNGSGVGIGSTTPFARLGISGLNGTNALLVATSTGTAFIIDSQGRLGVGTTSPNVALDVVGAIISREYAANGGATITIDWSKSTQQRVTLSQAGHTINFTNVQAGGGYRLIVCQDNAGGRTVTTWDSINIWAGNTAPTLTSTGNKCDILAFTATFATSTAVRLFGQSAGSNF